MSWQKFTPAQIMKMTIPQPEMLVDNLIVMGSAVIFPAREKAGKGLLAVDLGCSIALGEPWLGNAVLEGPVVYMALEESIGTIRERLKARLHGNFDVPFYLVPLDGTIDQGFQLENPQDVQSLAELVDELKPMLVIIDPLREAHSGREDAADDMAVRLRAIRQLAHQTGTTFLVSHHASKMAGGSRGSTAIKAAFDDELAFTRNDELGDREIRGTIRAEGRNLRKHSIGVVFDAHTGRWTATGEPEIVADVGLHARIVHLLEESGEWLTAREIADRLPGIALKTVQNKLSEMVSKPPYPVAVSGQPTRGNPRRFHSLEQRIDMFPDRSGNDSGNQGMNARIAS